MRQSLLRCPTTIVEDHNDSAAKHIERLLQRNLPLHLELEAIDTKLRLERERVQELSEEQEEKIRRLGLESTTQRFVDAKKHSDKVADLENDNKQLQNNIDQDRAAYAKKCDDQQAEHKKRQKIHFTAMREKSLELIVKKNDLLDKEALLRSLEGEHAALKSSKDEGERMIDELRIEVSNFTEALAEKEKELSTKISLLMEMESSKILLSEELEKRDQKIIEQDSLLDYRNEEAEKTKDTIQSLQREISEYTDLNKEQQEIDQARISALNSELSARVAALEEQEQQLDIVRRAVNKRAPDCFESLHVAKKPRIQNEDAEREIPETPPQNTQQLDISIQAPSPPLHQASFPLPSPPTTSSPTIKIDCPK